MTSFISLFSLTTCHLCHQGNRILCQNCLQKINPYGETADSLILYHYKGHEIHTILQWAKYKRLYKLYIPPLNQRKNDIISFVIKHQIDIIVPIPSPQRRILLRGLNHTQTIATHLSLLTNRASLPLLRKEKYTKRQALLTRTERLKGQRDSFSVNKPNVIHGKRILIVDDIITSGATTRAATDTLLQSGAIAVYTFAIAH